MGIFENLSVPSAIWLRDRGPENDIVISSRIRLARNLEGFPYSQWASTGELKRVADLVLDALAYVKSLQPLEKITLQDIDDIKKQCLQERHLVSKEFVEGELEKIAIIGPNQAMSVMINEEDHIRMQFLTSGLDLINIWEELNKIDDILEERLDYAFSDRWGYLTACPTNVGTGIRCSVMVHLPGLVMTKNIEKMLDAVTKIGLTVRGLYGEGTDVSGHLFQISNQYTLGASEIEIIDKVQKIAAQIINSERESETELLRTSRESVADRVWRAYGILSNVHVISYQETIDLLSYLRLGKNLGLMPTISIDLLNEILITTRPAHLQIIAGTKLEPKERDICRARIIRQKLQNICDHPSDN